MAVTTSPARRPAASAAPDGEISWMRAPTVVDVSIEASETAAPSKPCVPVPVSMISLAIRCARFAGTAKPTPMLPAVD